MMGGHQHTAVGGPREVLMVPPRTPNGTADCPLGAPMGGNQQEHGWTLFHIHVPKCISILAGLLLPALLMATTETV